ncbi:MAG: polysaccharide biosynthesis protein [Gemmatimonadales bacterium]|nr:polysaccharide biosynthesis protein [Gemmatimonadales bacterium]
MLRNRHFFLLDVVGLLLVPFIALALRFEGLSWPAGYLVSAAVFAAVTLPIRLGFAWRAGLYSCMWQHASIVELERILTAAMLAAAANLVVGLALGDWLALTPQRMPYSVLALDALFAVTVLATPRLAVRLLHRRRKRIGERVRTIVVGAGSAGQMIANESVASDRAHFEVVAFVDDDAGKLGKLLNGIRVEGRIDDLPRLIRSLGATEVIIAMPSARGTAVRRVVELAVEAGARTRTVPSLGDLVSGRVEVTALRPVEIQDLLRRAPITTDIAAVRTLAEGKTVLVTGAGGSIGSELCRQIAALRPELLVLLDHSENQVFEIEGELRRRFPTVGLAPVVADIRDERRMRRTFERFRPFAVFHAAAHKHVPLMEENVSEAVTNNVLGTRNVVEAAVEFDVTHLVLISTDKAVRPTSIMGATKRLAELIVRLAAAREKRHFVAVRFGNVLGSRGSVVPTFMAQIERGGPVTVTHPDMRRFFMTIPEAVQLVLQAGALGNGGELFVLDMGDAVKIADLARDLIRLSGLEEGVDIELRYTGIRPGEKLYEEVLFGDEDVRDTAHAKVLRVLADEPDEALRLRIDELVGLATHARVDERVLREALQALVPDFHVPERRPDVLPLRPRTTGEHRTA